MGSNAVEDLIEVSSGVHYSGFHMEQPHTPEIEQPTTSIDDSFHKQPFIIGVAGGAASGKTTVCDLIIEQLRDQRVVLVNQPNNAEKIPSIQASHEAQNDRQNHTTDTPITDACSVSASGNDNGKVSCEGLKSMRKGSWNLKLLTELETIYQDD